MSVHEPTRRALTAATVRTALRAVARARVTAAASASEHARKLRTKAADSRDVVTIRAKRLRHALGVPKFLATVTVIFGWLLAQELEVILDTQAKITGALVALAALMLLLAYRWSSQLPSVVNGAAYGTSGNGKLGERRGVVLLVGLDSADLKRHRPEGERAGEKRGGPSAAATLFAAMPQMEYLALIGTPEVREKGIFDELTSQIAPAAGIDLSRTHVRTWDFVNAESVADTEEATSEAIRWMLGRGLDPSQVVVDVSAGRRAMCFGAKDAADESMVETQYLAAQWDSVLNRPIEGTSMFKIIKAYH